MCRFLRTPFTLVAATLVASLSSAAENNLSSDQDPAAGTSVLFLSDEEREIAFKNSDRGNPVRRILASKSPLGLARGASELPPIRYEVDGQAYGLDDFTTMSANRGIVVVQDGEILFEHYSPGNDEETRWISFSVSKSVTSLLIGAAIQDGYIASVEEPVAHYLPRLRGSSYENVSIKQVLQMSSGVAWNEDYTDPNSDVAKAGTATGLELISYLATLPRAHTPGEVFNYNTGETNLAGELLRAAIGNNASTYLTHKIWQPFGMEADANWTLGFEGGGETGGCCISATLRDYARIGLFVLNNGKLADGTQVIPEDWVQQSMTPSKGAPYYGYQWWLIEGAYRAIGIFEQHIIIDPERDLVIAIHSNAPTATESKYAEHIESLATAIRQSVN